MDADETCGRDCMCESVEAHEAACERELRAFLADPGPPPAGWSPERVARAEAGMDEARRRLA